MKILSLFDGISCGRVALERAGIPVEEYHAFEVDQYAIQVSEKNYPDIVHHGDVFKGNFEDFSGFDMLIGGSPCFTAGHLILTDKGYKDISEIQTGDMVLTHMNRYRPVTRLYRHQAETVKLKIMGCPEFTVTENHPFLAKTKLKAGNFSESEWTKVKDMNESTYCAIHLNIAEEEMIDTKDFHIESNMFWTAFKSMKKTGLTETVYNIEVEEDHSYTVNNCIVHNCTYWSIAQSPNKRETQASGIGWELFSQYVRALREMQPEYFVYENNYSMADTIRESITETFGFEPVMIDSALLSGQSRKRLYWVGKRNADGEYERCVVPEPTDKGILLKDVLESGTAWNKKSYCITASYHPSFQSNLEKHRNTMIAESVETEQIPINPVSGGKAHTICATYGKIGESPFSPRGSERAKQRIAVPVRVGEIGKGGQGQRVYSVRGKSVTLSANGGGQGAKTGLYQIDLPDGDYIIRKLTPIEAERLQTLPDNYTEGISDTQRYKCIGNGWTVDVIAYLMKCAVSGKTEPLFKQLSFF